MLIMDLRLCFGWVGSPGHFYRWGKMMTHRTNTMRPSDVTDEMKVGPELMRKMKVEGPGLYSIELLPADPEAAARAPLAKGDATFQWFIYMDDSFTADLSEDDRALLSAAACLDSHYALLGYPRAGAPPAVKAAKFGDCRSIEEILGVTVNANTMERWSCP